MNHFFILGDIEDFPGLDSIPCYSVEVVDGEVKVRARKSDLQSNKRLKNMVTKDSKNNNVFIIVGGGEFIFNFMNSCRTARMQGPQLIIVIS